MSVIERVVEKGFCSGCGLCAGICPSEALEMGFDAGNNLAPSMKGPCSSCGLCVEVCPFSGEGPTIDDTAQELFGDVPGISLDPVSGFSLSIREGHVSSGEFRSRGASGGMASWFLTKVLEQGAADAVLSVGPDRSRPGFWTFIKAKDAEGVASLAGSVYHPVSIDSALRQIFLERNDDRYAFVALPCLAYGLRKAVGRIGRLKQKTALIVSLTCGLLPNRRYAEYISLASGVLPKDMGNINFRLPSAGPDCENFSHLAFSRNGEKGQPVPVMGLPGLFWRHGVFIQSGCLICDDVFGETADAVFMDAWLPEYSKDTEGNSIVICRTPQAEQIIAGGKVSGECAAEEMGQERLVRSQEETLILKRRMLAGRLARLEETGLCPPVRRVAADRGILEEHRRYFRLCEDLGQIARETNLETFEDMDKFRRQIEPLLEEERRMRIEGVSPFGSLRQRSDTRRPGG